MKNKILSSELLDSIRISVEETLETQNVENINIFNAYACNEDYPDGFYAALIYPLSDFNFVTEHLTPLQIALGIRTERPNNPDYFTLDDDGEITFYTETEAIDEVSVYKSEIATCVIQDLENGIIPPVENGPELLEMVNNYFAAKKARSEERRNILNAPYTIEFKKIENEAENYKNPIFWGFSNEQYEESKKEFFNEYPDQKEEDLISIGGGGFTTRPLAAKMSEFYKGIRQRKEKLLNEHNDLLMYQFEMALNDYEYIISGDPEEAVQSVLGIMPEELSESQNKALNKAIKNYESNMEWLGY